MFDIGFWELVLIAIIGLLVVGPDRLPGFARETGRWLRKIRRLTSDARRELQRELQWDEDDAGTKEIGKEVGNLKDSLSNMDRLMQNAPDRQPDHKPEYTPDGARLEPDHDNTDRKTGDGNNSSDRNKT